MPIAPPRSATLRLNRASPSIAQPYQASDVDIDALHLRFWKACAPRRHQAKRETHNAQHAYLASRKTLQSPTILFDQSFYLNQLPWFVRSNVDPLDHYLRIGWSQGLAPHIAFDSVFLAEKLGIQAWSEPPLLAYFEQEIEVSPHPLFDVDIYAKYVNLAQHDCARLFEVFLGAWPSTAAPFSRFFSLYFYGKFELVTKYGGINPLVHYLAADPERKRDPCPMLHNRWYDIHYPALEREPQDPLARYVRVGLDRGDLPNPLAAQELKLLESDGGAPTELLLDYVDVSAMDAEWFSSGSRYGGTRRADIADEATHSGIVHAQAHHRGAAPGEVVNQNTSANAAVGEMPSPTLNAPSEQPDPNAVQPPDAAGADTPRLGGMSSRGASGKARLASQ